MLNNNFEIVNLKNLKFFDNSCGFVATITSGFGFKNKTTGEFVSNSCVSGKTVSTMPLSYTKKICKEILDKGGFIDEELIYCKSI